MFGSWILLFLIYFPGFAIDRSEEAQSFGTRELFSHWNTFTWGKGKIRAACTIPINMDIADFGGFRRINVVLQFLELLLP